MRKRHRHQSHCGCPRPNCGCTKEVVHPVKQNVVHCCSEENVKHVHPSHTTVVNHHLIKNEHVYPHSTSYENTVNEVDVYGGAFNTPPMGPGNQVGGAMSPGMGTGRPPYGTMPGQVEGMGPHNHGMGCGHSKKGFGKMKHGKKPWC